MGKKAIALNERKDKLRQQREVKAKAEEKHRKILEEKQRNLETAKKLDLAMRMNITDPCSGE